MIQFKFNSIQKCLLYRLYLLYSIYNKEFYNKPDIVNQDILYYCVLGSYHMDAHSMKDKSSMGYIFRSIVPYWKIDILNRVSGGHLCCEYSTGEYVPHKHGGDTS